MKFEDYPLHDSPRGWFGRALYFEMQKDPNLWLFTGDLGWAMLDKIRDDFPRQFFNCGASEQCMVGAAVGATLSGKTVVCYSITSFLLYRGFEWLRNYLNYESIPVLLAGSGLDNDYSHDGITHQTYDAKAVLDLFPNIVKHFPEKKEQVPLSLRTMLEEKKPAYLCLRR